MSEEEERDGLHDMLARRALLTYTAMMVQSICDEVSKILANRRRSLTGIFTGCRSLTIVAGSEVAIQLYSEKAVGVLRVFKHVWFTAAEFKVKLSHLIQNGIAPSYKTLILSK